MSDKKHDNTLQETEELLLQSLEESEEKYRAMFENAPMCYQSLNNDGNIIDVNPAWLSTLGYKRDEVIGKPFSSFLLPDFVPHFKKNFPEFKKRGRIDGVKFQIRHKDGSYRFVEFSGCIGYNPDGSFRQTYCVFKDITALKRNEERLNSILNRSPFPVALEDLKNEKILYWSQSAINKFGHNPGSVSEWYELAYPDPEYREEVIKRWKPFLKEPPEPEKTINTGEYRITCKDGSVKICEIYAQYIPGNLIVTFDDITEKKKNEKKLKRVTEELKLAQKIAKIGNWFFDPAVGVPKWSDETFRINERDKELGPIPLSEFHKLYPPDQLETLKSAIIDAKEKGIPYDIELLLRLPSGTEKWINAICEPLPEKGPNGYCLLGTVQDITERKQHEEELKSRVEYEKLISTISTELSGLKIEEVDQAIDKTLSLIGDYTESDRAYIFQFKNNFSLVDNTHEYCAEGIEPQIKNLQDISIEKEVPWLYKIHRDGKSIVIPDVKKLPKEAQVERKRFESQDIKSLIIYPIKRADKLVGFMGIDSIREYRDWNDDHKSMLQYCSEELCHIIEWKRNEEIILALEKRNQALLDHSPVCHKIVDLDLNLQYMNANGFKMLDIELTEDLYGKPYPFDFFPEETRHELTENMKKVIETKEQIAFEGKVFDSKGNEVWLYHTIIPVTDNNNKIDYLTIVSADITEQKEMQARIRQSEKMDAIGQLAGGVAHDFNNQLSVVLGYADMLALRLDDPGLKQYAESICAAARRSSDLTSKLLAFSRKGQYQLLPVHINNVIQDTVEMLQHSVDKKITIKQELNAQETTVKGDASSIQNALLNISLNACHAMHGKGTLTFSTESMEIDGKFEKLMDLEIKPGNYIRISVKDTGTGIPEDVLPHIFEPFFTTKPQGKGTGMGLASVYGTIKQHNGGILVDSKIDKGTCFDIYLPLSESVSRKSVKDSVEKKMKDSINILVVDDEKMVRDLGCEVLSSDGHLTITAENGKEAVDIYRENWQEIDLVLLDMMMPKMNGKEAFRAMKKINPEVKVLIASGYSRDGDSEEILEEGAVGFVQKPFDINQLLNAVEDAFFLE